MPLLLHQHSLSLSSLSLPLSLSLSLSLSFFLSCRTLYSWMAGLEPHSIILASGCISAPSGLYMVERALSFESLLLHYKDHHSSGLSLTHYQVRGGGDACEGWKIDASVRAWITFQKCIAWPRTAPSHILRRHMQWRWAFHPRANFTTLPSMALPLSPTTSEPAL